MRRAAVARKGRRSQSMELITLIIEFLAIAVGVGLFMMDRRARRAEAEEERRRVTLPPELPLGHATDERE